MEESGIYKFHALGIPILSYITQFPVACWFALGPEQTGSGDKVLEGNFTMVSTIGIATTWQMSTTIAGLTTSQAPITSSVSSTSSGSAAQLSPASSNAGNSSPTSTPASIHSSSSSGLSTGAKIGIGVGVGVGALLLIGAIFYALRTRRKLSSAEARLSVMQQDRGVHEKDAGYQQKHAFSKYQPVNSPAQPIYESGGEPVRSIKRKNVPET